MSLTVCERVYVCVCACACVQGKEFTQLYSLFSELWVASLVIWGYVQKLIWTQQSRSLEKFKIHTSDFQSCHMVSMLKHRIKHILILVKWKTEPGAGSTVDFQIHAKKDVDIFFVLTYEVNYNRTFSVDHECVIISGISASNWWETPQTSSVNAFPWFSSLVSQ